VERQGCTWKDRVIVGSYYPSLEALQQVSNQAWATALPSRNHACAGLPPLVTHPELTVPYRRFSPTEEAKQFDFERVELYLADWRCLRQVDKAGKFSIADHNICFGRSFYRQTVVVTCDLAVRSLGAGLQHNPRVHYGTSDLVPGGDAQCAGGSGRRGGSGQSGGLFALDYLTPAECKLGWLFALLCVWKLIGFILAHPGFNPKCRSFAMPFVLISPNRF